MEEIPQRPDRDMTPEQTAAAEELADKRGISIDMAERAILGIRIEDAGSVPTPKASRRPRHSRRGGRAYPEKSGRDISREMANQEAAEHAPTPLEERLETSARGRAAIEAALDEEFGKDRKIKAIEEEVNRLIPIDPDNVAKSEEARHRLLTARLRIHFDKQ